MTKTFNEIEMLVESKSKDFYKYLQNIIPYSLMSIINSISQETNVYLFSGLIRNYFLSALSAGKCFGGAKFSRLHHAKMPTIYDDGCPPIIAPF